jgi:hypothetical protein
MTLTQEDALYEFLENVTEPFTLENVVAFVRMLVPQKNNRLAKEITALIDSRNIAFRLGDNQWVSRRGCFEPIEFVISPSRLELLNGILIPGHRCVPFANPVLMPQEYVFYWRGAEVPATTTESSPEELYPYYTVFGEEYAPQYVARDNPENEDAFNSDPYEDPPEVSIHTLDMRNIYRETSFVPGDRFVVKTLDWKAGLFELDRVGKDAWSQADLYAWSEAAEAGFRDSFEYLGPGSSTDEQIAYAYWYGGKRMRELPAYSLEEFLYEKTEQIEIAAYGIETRFWYAGKEIPDRKNLEGALPAADRTFIEDVLFQQGIPISEYVIQSYVKDSLYRNDTEIAHIVERIIPRSIGADERVLACVADYVTDVLEEFTRLYTLFADQAMGPIRQRVGELHTAVIDLSARLRKGDIDPSWLPKHTFVVLSQIQGHAASVMEDLDVDEAPAETELEAMDNSLDSMIETYEDIKELIDEALDGFRRSNISVVRKFAAASPEAGERQTVQISIGGTDIWRRVVLPGSYRLDELHRIIELLFGWKDGPCRFTVVRSSRSGDSGNTQALNLTVTLEDLAARGVIELLYEYGTRWTVKLMLLSEGSFAESWAERGAGRDGGEAIRCVAGAGAAPPGFIDGPVRFRKFLAGLERGSKPEHLMVVEKLGGDFDPDEFDLAGCNRFLASQFVIKNHEPGLAGR